VRADCEDCMDCRYDTARHADRSADFRYKTRTTPVDDLRHNHQQKHSTRPQQVKRTQTRLTPEAYIDTAEECKGNMQQDAGHIYCEANPCAFAIAADQCMKNSAGEVDHKQRYEHTCHEEVGQPITGDRMFYMPTEARVCYEKDTGEVRPDVARLVMYREDGFQCWPDV